MHRAINTRNNQTITNAKNKCRKRSCTIFCDYLLYSYFAATTTQKYATFYESYHQPNGTGPLQFDVTNHLRRYALINILIYTGLQDEYVSDLLSFISLLSTNKLLLPFTEEKRCYGKDLKEGRARDLRNRLMYIFSNQEYTSIPPHVSR